jgi:predicted nucleotidyltransferase component of viral defense system
MREDIIRAASAAGPGQGLNAMRELLQWEVIAALHEAEAFRKVAFIGGTSLRLLRGIGRFSEDLDFSVTGQEVDRSELEKWAQAIEQRMTGAGIANTETQIGGTRAVRSVALCWSEVLKEAGLSPLERQKLRIKLEIDCNPPDGAQIERVTRATPYLLAITTYDLPSLMAGKLHALLARPYTKGRDWYDLLWYCGNQIEPNIGLLKNALAQIPSEWCQDAAQWRESLRSKAEKTDWRLVREEVKPFLARPAEAQLLENNTVQTTLQQRGLNPKLERPFEL